jgi:hypothetical protein
MELFASVKKKRARQITKTPRQRKKGGLNARSKILEMATSCLLMDIRFVEYKYFGDFCEVANPPANYVIRNYPHTSLYGTPGKKERFIHYGNQEYVFEAKLQNTSGSVDEKLPYLWECFLASEVPSWIIYFDGNYWCKDQRASKAIEWLRERIRTQCPDGRHLYVCLSIDEWIALAKRLFNK